MTRKHKKILCRIILAAVMTALLHFVPASGLLRFALYLLPYLTVGYDILIKAARGIYNRQSTDECFLMAVATIGALAVGLLKTGDFLEAVFVMLFYQTGELFQSVAVHKSRRSISALLDIRPDYANIERDGELERVDPYDVAVGTVITVLTGERVPIDGVVIEGSAALDTSALTGESLPREVQTGDSIVSGCINLTGVLKIRTEKEFCDSTVSRILELAESAASHKSNPERFVARFARIYTPAVCIAALALALIPPAVRTVIGVSGEWLEWLYRALTFLVISCPCALVIGIPLTFFAGIGGSSRAGILVKGSTYLETLSKVRFAAFDKTGTLTRGVFSVQQVCPQEGTSEDELIFAAALCESSSAHPIAKAVLAACKTPIPRAAVTEVRELGGMGITAVCGGRHYAAGNGRLMNSLGITPAAVPHTGAVVHVARDGVYLGCIIVSDTLKDTACAAVAALKSAGVERTVMLTGDRREAAEAVAAELGLDGVHHSLLPEDKVSCLQSLKDEGVVLFVGDGINDAPVLATADVGIAMGALGSDAAIESADVVIMDDDPLKVAKAVRISKKVMRIVRQNMVFSLLVKGVCLILGALGAAGMPLAVFADVGVMVLAVLNALRAMNVKNI